MPPHDDHDHSPSEESNPAPTKRLEDVPGVRTARGPAVAAPLPRPGDGFDPFARMFRADGTLDGEYARKRIPTLVELLRSQPHCFDVRIDLDLLAERMLGPEAEGLRAASDEDAFDAAMAQYSGRHLHELIDDKLPTLAAERLRALAAEPRLTRRERVAAALGVAILSGVPDRNNLRGRAFFDLVFRVSMEELHAQEGLRQESAASEGGLSAEDLQKFWANYPALRHRYEQRYRREMSRVIRAIEDGEFPQAISVDLALRGAAALMTAVKAAQEAGSEFGMEDAQAVLREPFQQDLLDGRDLVLERWRTAAHSVTGATAEDRRKFTRTVETAIRLVEDGGPAPDVIVFFSYLRALVDGQFFVESEDEADAARGIFQEGYLDADAVVSFAAWHAENDRTEAQRRLLVAAVELWPEHEGIRDAAVAQGDLEAAAAGAERQGPTYHDDDEGGAEEE